MNILVLNCGSSTVKFQLFQMPGEQLKAHGFATKNRAGKLEFNLQDGSKKVHQIPDDFSFTKVLKQILNELQNPENKILLSSGDIDAVAHRLIHGGENAENCVEVTGELIDEMKSNISLAPLHYPANIEGIEAVKKLLPDVLQTGVFDTAFHQTIPPKAFLYGIPLSWYEKHKIRKFGFHGTSHKYVSQRACELTGMFFGRSKIISCHLGNGASVAAINNGKSVDTSMGLTPVEGLLMGTRSGDIDAGLLVYLQQNFNLSTDDIQQLVNNEGGLLGLSGISSDYRQVEEAAVSGNEKAKTALKVYWYRIKKYIGSYLAVLGGANVIVFTGGVGENSALTREMVCEGLESFGIRISKALNNEMNGKEAVISETGAKVKVAIVPTNEELLIARETYELVKLKQNK